MRACPTGAVDLRKYTDSLISSHLQHAILATSHHRVCWIRHSTHGCWQAACTGVFGRTENALDVIGLSFGRIFAKSIKSNSYPRPQCLLCDAPICDRQRIQRCDSLRGQHTALFDSTIPICNSDRFSGRESCTTRLVEGAVGDKLRWDPRQILNQRLHRDPPP